MVQSGPMRSDFPRLRRTRGLEGEDDNAKIRRRVGILRNFTEYKTNVI